MTNRLQSDHYAKSSKAMKTASFLLLTLISVSAFETTYAQTAGTVDMTFEVGTGFNQYTNQVVLQPDGKILVTGEFTEYNGTTANRIIRLNSDGSVDPSFNSGSGFNGLPYIVLQQDGKLLVSGAHSTYNGATVKPLIRLNADGSVDNTFDIGNIADGINRVVVQSSGKIVVEGSFNGTGGIPSTHDVARLNEDGSVEPTFTTQDAVSRLVRRTDNDTLYIIRKEVFDEDLGTWLKAIVELQPDGEIAFGQGDGFYYPSDQTPNVPNFINEVFDILLLPDQRMIVGGRMERLFDTSQVTKPHIGMLNEALHEIDSSFQTGIGFDFAVTTLEQEPSGKVLVGGMFTSYNGTPTGGIARLNLDGSIDNGFQTGTGLGDGFFAMTCTSIAIQPDGKILVAGDFQTYNGVARKGIVRLNGDATSVPAQRSESFSVYPNPGQGLYQITGVDFDRFKVLDAAGRMVLADTPVNDLLNLSSLPDGLYVVQILTEQGWLGKKLLKQS